MFKGSIVALITPFTEDNKVDYSSLKALIRWHLQEGTDGIVLCGTTGESPTLSCEEQLQIFEVGVEAAEGKMPIIAGTGSYSTDRSVAMTRRAKEIGVNGALVIVPYYNRPTPEGCLLHYRAVNQVGLPFIVYHHPKRTGLKLSVETLKQMSALDQVVGIKEASGDMDLTIELLHTGACPILSGDDVLTIPLMALGATGVISVIANIMPKPWKQLTDWMLAGDLAQACALFKHYYPLCKAMMLETNPQCIKYALHLMHKCTANMRLPLMEPQPNVRDQIAGLLEREVKEGAGLESLVFLKDGQNVFV